MIVRSLYIPERTAEFGDILQYID